MLSALITPFIALVFMTGVSVGTALMLLTIWIAGLVRTHRSYRRELSSVAAIPTARLRAPQEKIAVKAQSPDPWEADLSPGQIDTKMTVKVRPSFYRRLVDIMLDK